MKKFLLIVSVLLLTLSLTACIHTSFKGTRSNTDDEFAMEYSVFNTTDSQELTAKSGDTLSAEIVVDKGSLSVKIQNADGVAIYENNDISASTTFDIDIVEDGTYTIEVTGYDTEGSVDFIIKSN